MALYDDFINPGFGVVQNPLLNQGFNTGFGWMAPQPVAVPGSAPPLAAAPVIHNKWGVPYNAPGPDLSRTAVGRRAADLNPTGVYQRFLNVRGFGDPNSALGKWATNQYGRVQDMYNVAQLQNPGLRFDTFLKQGGAGKLMRDFLALTPQGRGSNQQTRTSRVMWG